MAFNGQVQLGPLETIVNVQWTTSLLVLSFHLAYNNLLTGGTAFATLNTDLSKDSTNLMNNGFTFREASNVKGQTVPIAPQISAEMISGLRAWSLPFYRLTNSELIVGSPTICTFGHWQGAILADGAVSIIFGGDFATGDEAFAAFSVGFEELVGRPPVPNVDLVVWESECFSAEPVPGIYTSSGTEVNAQFFFHLGKVKSVTKKNIFKLKVAAGANVPGASDILTWRAQARLYNKLGKVNTVDRFFPVDSVGAISIGAPGSNAWFAYNLIETQNVEFIETVPIPRTAVFEINIKDKTMVSSVT